MKKIIILAKAGDLELGKQKTHSSSLTVNNTKYNSFELQYKPEIKRKESFFFIIPENNIIPKLGLVDKKNTPRQLLYDIVNKVFPNVKTSDTIYFAVHWGELNSLPEYKRFIDSININIEKGKIGCELLISYYGSRSRYFGNTSTNTHYEDVISDLVELPSYKHLSSAEKIIYFYKTQMLYLKEQVKTNNDLPQELINTIKKFNLLVDDLQDVYVELGKQFKGNIK